MRKPVLIVSALAALLAAAVPGAAQVAPQVKEGAVAITGENPFISLALEEGGKTLTSVSFWRVVHSPAGVGHACYVLADLTGDGPSGDDIKAVFTDNPKLVEYLNKEIMSAFDRSYADDPYPVHAAVFTKAGDGLAEHRETVTAGGTKVELVWRDFLPAVLVEIPVKPYVIFTTLVPARTAEVAVNGKKAAGRVFPRPEGTAQGSTGTLALAETWLKRAK
ncbi:MAG TPA: hypothetical protein PLP83_05730 [Candidatus Aminicenantes bacterium]|nr:hypothetical protein [Candidatus Aminicenantes bacterium]